MALAIKMGGLIRWPFDVDPSTSVEWDAGEIVKLDPTTLQLKTLTSTSNAGTIIGVVLESKRQVLDLANAPGSGFTADRTRGSGKASLLLSPAVIETDQLPSGIEIKAGDVLYYDVSGNFTKTVSADGRKMGMALENVPNTGVAGAKLLILYNPTF